MHNSLHTLQLAVQVLGLTTLALAVFVYFLMQIRHHLLLAREARRLMLSSLLYPSWDAATLRQNWSTSPRADRELLEEVLVGHRQLLEGEEAARFEHAILTSGIYEHWLSKLSSRSTSARWTAARRLGYFHDSRGIQALTKAIDNPSPAIALAAAMSLGRLRDPEGLDGLMGLAQKPGMRIPDLTIAAALAGCAKGCPQKVANLLASEHRRVRLLAAWALSEVADSRVLPQLGAGALDPDPEVRAKVARALAKIPGQESLALLGGLLMDRVWFVRVRALDALGKLGDRQSEPVVLALLADKTREVRFRAAYALRQIAGMKSEVAGRVLDFASRRGFNTLMSEWEREGFLWGVAGDLTTRNWERFEESKKFLSTLISAGVSRALVSFLLAFPDLKVRLRLVRLLAQAPTQRTKESLVYAAERPECDRRVAVAIRRRLAEASKTGGAMRSRIED